MPRSRRLFASAFHEVATQRRVYREDVLDYKTCQLEEAEEAMQNLTDQARSSASATDRSVHVQKGLVIQRDPGGRRETEAP